MSQSSSTVTCNHSNLCHLCSWSSSDRTYPDLSYHPFLSNPINPIPTASAPMELTLWPEFHNGVAAGLRVNAQASSHITSSHGANKSHGLTTPHPPSPTSDHSLPSHPIKKRSVGGRQGYDGTGAVTRNWIIYNRTASSESPSFHAGVLLSLGLQGHLTVLSVTDICDYLTQGHEPTGDSSYSYCLYIDHILTNNPIISPYYLTTPQPFFY